MTLAGPRRPVLDASAVLALLAEEDGADEVEAVLDGAAISTVNLSEVLQKSAQHGIQTEGLEYDLEALGLELIPFDSVHARLASDIWERAPRAGLSLGDRSCLAVARAIDGTAFTTDRAWAKLGLDVEVRVIR